MPWWRRPVVKRQRLVIVPKEPGRAARATCDHFASPDDDPRWVAEYCSKCVAGER